MAEDIRDMGDGWYRYNNNTYANKTDAENARMNDIYRERERYWSSKKKSNSNNEGSGCLGYLILIPLIAIGAKFGITGIIFTFLVAIAILIMIGVSMGRKKAANQKINQAWDLYNSGKPTQAFCIVQNMGNDYPGAACILSFLYYTGQGCEQNFEKAFYYSKIGKKNDPDVHAIYGSLLYYGNGCEENQQQGIQELILSITAGSNLGRLRLEEIHINNNNADENTIKNLNISAEDGFNFAYYLLASVYLQGNGKIQKDEVKSFQYMKKAAELGVSEAIDFFDRMNGAET